MINPDSEGTYSINFWRAALGHSNHASARIATRFEGYYRKLFSDGKAGIDFNVAYIGLMFTVSYSL